MRIARLTSAAHRRPWPTGPHAWGNLERCGGADRAPPGHRRARAGGRISLCVRRRSTHARVGRVGAQSARWPSRGAGQRSGARRRGDDCLGASRAPGCAGFLNRGRGSPRDLRRVRDRRHVVTVGPLRRLPAVPTPRRWRKFAWRVVVGVPASRVASPRAARGRCSVFRRATPTRRDRLRAPSDSTAALVNHRRA
jgi:hypothetical protein